MGVTTDQLVILLSEVLAKGVLVLAIACVAAACVRSSAHRFSIWWSAFLIVLAMPILVVVTPQWRILPAWMDAPSSASETAAIDSIQTERRTKSTSNEHSANPNPASPFVHKSSQGDGSILTSPSEAKARTQPIVSPSNVKTSPYDRIDLSAALVAIWFIGVLFGTTILAFAHWNLWKLAKQSTTSRSARLQDMLDQMCSECGIRRGVKLLLSQAAIAPMTWGNLRPRIMLPVSATQWPRETLRAALLHELAHIRRWDDLRDMIVRITVVVYWLNPLAWYGWRSLHRHREFACDDLVIENKIKPSSYAELLLAVSTASKDQNYPLAAMQMARRSTLERRVRYVLMPDQNRRSESLLQMMVTLVAFLAIGIPLSSLVAESPDTNTLVVIQDKNQPQTEKAPENKTPDDKTSDDKASDDKAPLKIESEWAVSPDDTLLKGVVRDNRGRPLGGAKVSLNVYLPNGKPVDQRLINVFQDDKLEQAEKYSMTSTTDVSGKYSLRIPAKLAKNDKCSLSFWVAHPDFATYSHPMLIPLKQFLDGTRIGMFHQDIRNVQLKRAYRLRGKVLLPNGKPAVGAVVQTQSKYRGYAWKFPRPQDYGFSDSAKTDVEGQFKLRADHSATLSIFLDSYAPIVIDDLSQRIGGVDVAKNEYKYSTYKLNRGITVQGIVMDEKNRPMPHVMVSASRAVPWSETNPRIGLSRSTLTNAKGEYTLPPLPPDDYDINVGGRVPKDVPASAVFGYRFVPSQFGSFSHGDRVVKFEDHQTVFLPRPITLLWQNPKPRFNLRAVEKTRVRVKIDYPDGVPDSLPGRGSIKGKWHGTTYVRYGMWDKDGFMTILVPRGLQNAYVDVGVSRFRNGPKDPWKIGRAIRLGTLDKDQLEIVNTRPKLAQLTVKLIGAEGDTLRKKSVNASYVRLGYGEQHEGPIQFPVYINQKPQGDYQGGVLPDEEFVLRVHAQGRNFKYAAFDTTLKLKPGEKRVVEVKLMRQL